MVFSINTIFNVCFVCIEHTHINEVDLVVMEVQKELSLSSLLAEFLFYRGFVLFLLRISTNWSGHTHIMKNNPIHSSIKILLKKYTSRAGPCGKILIPSYMWGGWLPGQLSETLFHSQNKKKIREKRSLVM